MNNFEYQTIKLDKSSWIGRFKEGFKMFYQRPILSFFPFLLISYLIFVQLLPIDASLTLKIIIFLLIYIMPLLTFELCSSNDYSKIPFKKCDYLFSQPIKNFYLLATFIISSIFLVIFLITMIIQAIDLIFPLLNNDINTPISSINENKSIKIFLLILLLILLTIQMFCGYVFLLYFNLVLHVIKMHNFSDSLNLFYLALEGINKNGNLLFFIFLFSFIQSLSILFSEVFIIVILWSFFSGFFTAIIYLMSKEISGGGSKLEKKESLLNKVVVIKPKLSQVEG